MSMPDVDRIRAELEAEAIAYAAALDELKRRTALHQERVAGLTEQLRRAMEQRQGTVRKLDEAIVPRNTRIRLDVGGQLFTVTMDMMTAYPDSFFGVLVSDRWNSSKDFAGDEVIFINRSAKLFSHILDFLRGDLDVVDLSAAKRKKLLREAHFYQLTEMAKLVGLPEREQDEAWVLKETLNGQLSNRSMTLRQCSEIGGECCMTIGSVGFLRGTHEWSVNLDTGGMGILLGVSLAGIDQTNVVHNEALHFVVSCTDGKVCSGSKWRPFFSQIPAGGMGVNTQVSLRLDMDRHCLSLGLNGLWRDEPAFSHLPVDALLFPYFVLGRNIGLQITVTRK